MTSDPPPAVGTSVRDEPRSPRCWLGEWGRWVAAGTALMLVWPIMSYVRALTYPGQADLAVRTVEWIRDNGGGGLVDLAENWWYSHPHDVGTAEPAAVETGPVAAPPSDPGPNAPASLPAPSGGSPLLGEGVWTPQAVTMSGVPAIYTTFVRPDNRYQFVVAGVALIKQDRTSAALIPGTKQPDQSTKPSDAKVPDSDRAALLATFNSGFKMKDAHGGFFLHGRSYLPLRDGAASLVIHTDGRATVAQWGRDATPGPDLAAVRQNLDLIVDGGRTVAGLDTNAHGTWGSTRNQLQYTWRSGVGVDRAGSLIYVAGANLTLATLAGALVTAGTVRAMELDIHGRMIDFYSYRHAGNGLSSTKLLPDMPNDETRYLAPDQRDFVAVLSR